MIRVFLFSIFMFAIAQAAAPAGWFTSARAAADAAKRQQLPIMIVFAGAEWSADSIEFRDKFLSNPEISRLIKANCVPLYVEIPPASAWTYKFKQRLRSSYAFLDLDIGIPLPMICFTNSNFKKLNVPEPDSNRNALRNALNASRIALEKIDEFCAFCRKNDLPLDFLGKTAYNRRLPRDFSDQSVSMRDIARKHGYHNVEIFMSEWHMCPRSWKKNFFDDRETIENAAFSAASIMLMQDVTDMAYFYIWASAGFYGLFSDPDSPFKVYYALCLYTEFIRKNGNVLRHQFHQ